jgi:hypothetical protein
MTELTYERARIEALLAQHQAQQQQRTYLKAWLTSLRSRPGYSRSPYLRLLSLLVTT